MKTIIYVVSDNHILEEPIDEIRDTCKDGDYFFHCGDSLVPYPLMHGYAAVKGNNDYDTRYPEELLLEIGGHRFLVTHGHRYVGMYGYSALVRYAKRLDCDVVCFGHTHLYCDETIDGIRLLNPGSVWHNRDGSEASFMRLEVTPEKIIAKRINYPFSLK